MKFVSVILIAAYLIFPVICFGHPCERLAPDAPHTTIASDGSGACAFDYDTDNCETTCCCAGHFPLSAYTEIPYVDLTASQVPYVPHLALPQLIDRIFVPPQNLS